MHQNKEELNEINQVQQEISMTKNESIEESYQINHIQQQK
jgi:hypothetical protein